MEDSMDERDERWIRAMLEIGAKTTEAHLVALEKDIHDIGGDLDDAMKDYESRFRSLEEFKWKAIGAAAIVGAIAGISANFLL